MPVVHLVEQFAVPSTFVVSAGNPCVRYASARLIQRCGGAAADYAHPALLICRPPASCEEACASRGQGPMVLMGSARDARSTVRPGLR